MVFADITAQPEIEMADGPACVFLSEDSAPVIPAIGVPTPLEHGGQRHDGGRVNQLESVIYAMLATSSLIRCVLATIGAYRVLSHRSTKAVAVLSRVHTTCTPRSCTLAIVAITAR